jgi:hypothetical protein
LKGAVLSRGRLNQLGFEAQLLNIDLAGASRFQTGVLRGAAV